MPVRNWNQAINQFTLHYDGRVNLNNVKWNLIFPKKRNLKFPTYFTL